MKTILIFFILSLQSTSFALSKNAFLALDEKDKENFINTQTVEVDDTESIELFQKENPNLVAEIMKQGEYLANIWGDTILEGPYSLTGDLEITIYSLYTFDGEPYAVLATVSSSAVFTDSCEYDEDADAWPDDCGAGTISESFVVDMAAQTIDFGYYAEFND